MRSSLRGEFQSSLTEDYPTGLSVSKLGHRKSTFAAIARLREDGSPNHDDIVSGLVEYLPHTVAMPFHEYVQEDHPTMKLWAACDVVELLPRFTRIEGK